MATTSKTGRKQKHFETKDGTQIKGLSRRPKDGRWRIIGTQITFTEPDENKAVEKFYELSRSSESDRAAYERLQGSKQIVFNSKKQLWKYFADHLQADPKRVAELTGLPTLQWFKSYHAPEDVPTLDVIRTNWVKHSKGNAEYQSKVVRHWDEFVKVTGVKSVDEIKPQTAIDFMDYIVAEGYAPKMQSHYFADVRAVIHLARKRAMSIQLMAKVLESLKLMTPDGKKNKKQATAISVANFQALLKTAKGDGRAMLLMMLNCALYMGEVVTVRWDEINENDTYVSQRNKTGEHIRCATLWPETVAALKTIKRKGDFVFNSDHGTQVSKFTAFDWFREWRDAAKLPTVTPSHLRDGAFAAAVSANVNYALCQLLMGHGIGQGDQYILANPEMVKPACDAARAKYITAA